MRDRTYLNFISEDVQATANEQSVIRIIKIYDSLSDMTLQTLQTRNLAANKIINFVRGSKSNQFINKLHREIQNEVRIQFRPKAAHI